MLAFLRGNPKFLRFWMATWCSEFGDWIRNMTLMYMVMDISNNSAVAVSINQFFEFAPIFFLGFFVGVLADRWNRKRTLVGSIGFRAVVMVLLMVAAYQESMILVYAVAALSAIGTVFFRAPQSAFMMQFVPLDDRRQAANLRQMSTSWMFVIGPSLGTFLYFELGSVNALILTCALFVLAAILLGTIASQEEEQKNQAPGGFKGVMQDMGAGFRYSWTNKIVRPILFTNVFLGLGTGIINVLSIFIITDFLGMDKSSFSILVTVQGVSMVVCSLLVAKSKMPTERMLPFGMLIMGVGMAMTVVYESFYVTGVGVALTSLGNVMFNIGMATLLQTKVDYQFQGRLNTTVMSIHNGFMMLSMLAAGWLYETFTIVPVVLGGGSSMILAGILSLIMYAKAVDPQKENSVGL
ncbi:hypothetical protein CBW65_22940 [Tumebacillus avium]|uniref:Major facilitator superfamily (MFS) profile domain-containing protein n=1 Tax=Tumebacillus avium TaxID=1903704 RepID=A0A1Y0IW26_9BACL|nr:MFS transporter [Tumebacillus avium]ARU63544.1 hypothetical protein CBW65_22940 [Tumebacillus avium]